MKGSESEAVFNSLNLNPQLFINEALNTVDDLVDDAFDFYQQQASTLLKIEGTDRSQDLSKGVAYIRNMIQSSLDKRLAMWEKYCLHHCFSVPEGFSLPKTNELPGESSISEDALCDPDLDGQLNSLRDKLNLAGKESVELNRELQALERQSTSSDRCAGLASEALQLYEENSMQDMLQEMMKMASELRMKMDRLKVRRIEDREHIRTQRAFNPKGELCKISHSKGLYNVELQDLQEFVEELKNI
ncbi:protein MIS12 homolog isoform X2 [Mangifera indica]|uniref:protein MIS12 homolog isoform X2 n=1 Tax=Mangifera indica TaxID=29780 RepID=UPI001CFABD63|nr:protein MIS12 homolog isoform X2 [Mangifera indica]